MTDSTSDKQTVVLIRAFSDFANVPDSFQVMMPAASIDEYTQTAETYYLPSGYSVAECITGELEIYPPQGDRCCEIVMHSRTRRPQLVGLSREMPVLTRVPGGEG